MRSRWEDGADEALDSPVTLTERQLRALKRTARTGVFAIPLALAAAGLAGWSLFTVLNPAQGVRADPAPATAQVQPAQAAPAPSTEVAAAPATTPPPGRPAELTPQAQPKPAAASPAAPARISRPEAKTARVSKPVTTTAQPVATSPSSVQKPTPVPAMSLPNPVPAAAETPKPAARDSSSGK